MRWGASAPTVAPITVETQPVPGNAWGCDWAPNGQTLAWHSDKTGNFEIYTQNIDGTDARQITSDAEADQLPRWSPDGSQLAWISTRGGEFDIWVGDANGGSARDITNDPALDDGFYGIAWLPDGSGIIAASSGRQVPAQINSESVPLGVGSIALAVILLAGALVFALRLAPSVIGLGTVIGLISGILLAMITPEPLLALSVIAAGVSADGVAWIARTRGDRISQVWAGIVPAMVFASAYFIVLALARGLAWTWSSCLVPSCWQAYSASQRRSRFDRRRTKEEWN